MIKTSEVAPAGSKVVFDLIRKFADENEVIVIEGDVLMAKRLLQLPFDHVFFTGSTAVGKTVMEAASKHLASVTLELGGKSPVWITDSADIKQAAERIIWGKCLNAGQTCVAPDYVLLPETLKTSFIEEVKRMLKKYYPVSYDELSKIISDRHFMRLKNLFNQALADGAKIECGGEFDSEKKFISPTLISQIPLQSPLMQEEIFGPILPVLTYRSKDEALQIVQSMGKPLAFYLFGKRMEELNSIIDQVPCGGININATLTHLANTHLPFGGTGTSGMGNYHGHFGFLAFSHEKSVMKQSRFESAALMRPPYTSWVKKIIEMTIRYFI